MRLSLDTVAQFAGGCLKNVQNAFVTSVTTDTREIKEGSLFVALKGEKFDGHDFAADAVKKGAVAVLSQRDADEYTEALPLVVVEDTYKALLSLAAGYRASLEMSVVGITGSVGKTTTKDMIAAVLSAAVKTGKTQGNFNNHIGVPRTIFSLSSEDKAAVIEMGMNHAGEISALTRVVRPDIAVITNIGVSHIEYLKTRQNILEAKLEILESMAGDAPLIINADNDILGGIYELDEHRIIRCSAEGNDAFVTATDICESLSGSSFKIYVGGHYLTEAFVPAVGMHNVQNALLAAAVGIVMGLSGEQIKKGLFSYVPSGMRQKITECAGMTFIEDCYNASPTSMVASLDVLATLKKTRAVAVLGDMLELGDISDEEHIKVGQYAAEKCDLVLCQGDAAKKMHKAAKDSGTKSLWFENREDTIAFLVNELQDGDCVLFKASNSMGFGKIVESLHSKLGE
ncbi:MAG: UDP-N-acetylmuramoyl-tripeptide--D-alanyl-D-alanine ligase [Oscillospiraceae bacterium]|nr:UDP-N-acetylmuramoyl-tripeptide--D-alanyl-D-alanine ligase [Oscillospiraceae bacterium]